jgi:glycosyltransferase involved in cell wall biosynthesis
MFFLRKKPCLYSAIVPKEPWGGSFTFTKHLLKYLEEHRWRVTFNPRKSYDVAFSTGWFLQGEALDRVTKKAPLLFRMDGLPSLYRNDASEASRQQERHMKEQAERAAHVVFQSRFCRESCRDWKLKTSSIILNGTDTTVFHPKARETRDRLIFLSASWSSNPHKGMPLFREMARALPRHEFRFMGHWPRDLSGDPVKIFPAGPQKELAAFLRQGDFFVHLALNDPCPNVLIEAIVSGLYPIVSDSGGNPEIIARRGYLWKDLASFLDDFDNHRLPRPPFPSFDAEHFSFDSVGRKYLEIFNEIRS